jgi:hypothetical protein
MGLLCLPLGAETGDVTLPTAVWAAIGAALVTAMTWVAKKYADAVAAQIALTREVTAAMTANSEVLRECTAQLKEVAELVREGKGNG